jgi:predicted MPP superfamily phosphohydrolase
MCDSNPIITILHLSDIHRTNDEPVSIANISTALRNDLQRQQSEEGLPRPDFLVISGDLTQSAVEEEYEETFNLIDQLKDELTVPDFGRVILVPGNHDINWDMSSGVFSTGRKKPKDADPALMHCQDGIFFWTDQDRYAKRLQPFRDFYQRLYGREYGTVRKDQFDVWPFPDDGLCFVGLNSCDQVDHLRSKGKIYEEAVYQADKRLRKKFPDATGMLKIAIWHHDLNWLARQELNDCLDPSILGQLVDAGYGLALCGHTMALTLGKKINFLTFFLAMSTVSW